MPARYHKVISFELMILAAYKNRSNYFTEKGLAMTSIIENLVDLVWAADRPARPQNKVFVHELKYAGITV